MGAIHGDALLALLSIGAEKMLKMTYALIIEDATGSWPSASTMRGFGHDVATLDRECRRLFRDRIHLATSDRYVAGLLDDLDADPFITRLLEILTRYGQAGRFAHLDALSGQAQPGEPPRTMWERYDTDLGLLAPAFPLSRAISNEDFDRLVRRPLNERHREIVGRWREVYFRALIHGLAGDAAKAYGWDLRPPTGSG